MNNPVDLAVYDRVRTVLEGEVMGVDDAPDVADSHTLGALEPTLIPAIEAARQLKAELRERYPGIKFNVRAARRAESIELQYPPNASVTKEELQTVADAYVGIPFATDDYGEPCAPHFPLPGRWIGSEFVCYKVTHILVCTSS